MKKILSLLLIFIIIHIFSLLKDAGVMSDLKEVPLNCTKIFGIHGPEDIQIVNNHMFLSSTYLPLRNSFEIGDIFYTDLSKDQLRLVSLAKHYKISPHGIHARDLGNKIRLWVVNHLKEFDSVEVFDFKDEVLTKVKSIRSPHYINANDIYSLNSEQFYLTHDHGSLNKVMRTFENFSRIGRGYVTLYDGQNVSKVLSGLSFPNGIAVHKKDIYIAQMLGKSISSYTMNKDLSLTKKDSLSLPYSPDNITVLKGGKMLIATHPQIFSLKAHALNHKDKSPSAILSLDLANMKLSTKYLNLGSETSASSVATNYKESLFIGNIYSDYFLRCNNDD